MATQPEPIRRTDLPTIPAPESELFTWFPHPDGGGDMVRGQRQRGVQVRRRLAYGDWEPIHPDHWADESAGQEVSAAAETTAQPPYRALLDRLERDRARSAGNASDSRHEEMARIFEGEEGAFRTAVEYTIQAFYGLEAAVAYHRDGVLPQGDPTVAAAAVFVPPPPGSTAEQLPADVLALIDPPPYLSTACGTAKALEEAVAEHPQRAAGLLEWADRMHQRCRINNKYTGKICTCRRHGEA